MYGAFWAAHMLTVRKHGWVLRNNPSYGIGLAMQGDERWGWIPKTHTDERQSPTPNLFEATGS